MTKINLATNRIARILQLVPPAKVSRETVPMERIVNAVQGAAQAGRPRKYERVRRLRELELLAERGALPSVRLVLTTIQAFADKHGTKARPGIRELAFLTGHDKGTVCRAIAKLEALGFLTTIKAHGRATRYRVTVPTTRTVEDTNCTHSPPKLYALTPQTVRTVRTDQYDQYDHSDQNTEDLTSTKKTSATTTKPRGWDPPKGWEDPQS